MVNKRSGWLLTLVLLVGPYDSLAHEVNVHRAITSRALDLLLSTWPEIGTCRAAVEGALHEGVTAEDDAYGVNPFIGRFLFHFSPRLDDQFTRDDILVDINSTCSSIDWGHESSPCEGVIWLGSVPSTTEARSNTHSYAQVVTALSRPGALQHREGLVSLGHYLHLLQDLTSPAHARNDAHPLIPVVSAIGDPSAFEMYNAERVAAGFVIPLPQGPLVTWSDPRAPFQELQAQTASDFWSEKNTLVGHGPASDRTNDAGYVFDARGRLIARAIRGTPLFTIDESVAHAQFDELGPKAVLYTALMINFILNQPDVYLCERAAPNNLTASTAGFVATLMWTPPVSGTPTGYVVEVGSQPGLSDVAVFRPEGVATALIRGFGPGRYYARVKASNAAVLSPPSNEVEFTLPASFPPPGSCAGGCASGEVCSYRGVCAPDGRVLGCPGNHRIDTATGACEPSMPIVSCSRNGVFCQLPTPEYYCGMGIPANPCAAALMDGPFSCDYFPGAGPSTLLCR